MENITRKEAIKKLASDAVDTMRNDETFCSDIARGGFRGFTDYSNKELEDAYFNQLDERVTVTVTK